MSSSVVAASASSPVPDTIYFATGRAVKKTPIWIRFRSCTIHRPPPDSLAGNKKKLEEVVAILEAGSKLPFTVLPAKLDLPELQGEPEEIAAEKCRLAAAELQAPGGVLLLLHTS